ncbi:hypothetical protein HZA26_01315 [Candidatus Nomurabacteria bacterium]|nr:hypothetical protein [Candidatus Nomurabacteria bacterium]
MKINLFKIKKEKLKTWQKWCELLNTRLKKQAIETLKEEGLTNEGFYFFKLDRENYTMGFSIGKHLPTNMTKKINKKHREKKKECLEYMGPISILYDLET